MNQIPGLLAISAVVLAGIAVIWANPGRRVNQVFFSFSLHTGLWLLAVHFTVVGGEQAEWIRFASAVGALITPHMWLLKEAILRRERLWTELPKRKYIWGGAAILLVSLIYTDWYIKPASLGVAVPHFGIGYYVYMLSTLGLYGLLWRETARQMKHASGVLRLELQIVLLGASVTAFAVLALMALRAILKETWPIRLQPFVVLVFYTGTVLAITAHRIFNARQIVLVVAQEALLVAVAAGSALGVDWVLHSAGIPEPFALLATVAVALWLVTFFKSELQRVFRFYPEATAARQAVYAIAQRETRTETMEESFRTVLKGWGKTDHALIVSGNSKLTGLGIEIEKDSGIVSVMRELRWATPERLARERTTALRQELSNFLNERGLGALVICEGPALTALVGVGVSATRLPYTYPQIIQLLELASIMESAFERAHFSAKAQHAEQLATVGLLGASLAHEIRNPLVSIKTFVQLLPQHHNDPKFREKFFRLITDEVDRIDQLTEQLLDLASPRTYTAATVALHPVLRSSLDLVTAKAAHKQVQFVADFNAAPDTVFTDPSAAKQVMLNLCFNAIQAVEEVREGPRCVWIATRNVATGVEMAVSDSGPGVAPEIMPRLFQPFQTTKSSGFGLGLAICSDILANLNASITVDPPAPGRGATFRVTFPCQPSSS